MGHVLVLDGVWRIERQGGALDGGMRGGGWGQIQREESRQAPGRENGKEQTGSQDLKQIFGCPGWGGTH